MLVMRNVAALTQRCRPPAIDNQIDRLNLLGDEVLRRGHAEECSTVQHSVVRRSIDRQIARVHA